MDAIGVYSISLSVRRADSMVMGTTVLFQSISPVKVMLVLGWVVVTERLRVRGGTSLTRKGIGVVEAGVLRLSPGKRASTFHSPRVVGVMVWLKEPVGSVAVGYWIVEPSGCV